MQTCFDRFGGKMNIWIKRLLIVAAVFHTVRILVMGAFVFLMFHTEKNHSEDIACYQALSSEMESPDVDCPYDLPRLSELEPCESRRFAYDERTTLLVTDEVYILIASYDEEDYGTRKSGLDSDYAYRTEMIEGVEDGEQISPVFEMDGFSFRAVEQEGAEYPKQMLFVGTCDDRRELAYIYCDNYDLDCISGSVEAHLREVSRWAQIVSQ